MTHNIANKKDRGPYLKRKKLKDPCVMFNKTSGHWCVDYQVFKQNSTEIQRKRKSFGKLVLQNGKSFDSEKDRLEAKKKAAEKWCKELKKQQDQQSFVGKKKSSNRKLTLLEMDTAEAAFSVIRELQEEVRKVDKTIEVSLIDAVHHYKDYLLNVKAMKPVLLKHVLIVFKSKKSKHLKKPSQDRLFGSMERFQKYLKNQNIYLHEIKSADIHEWLETYDNIVTQNEYFKDLKTFFNWALNPKIENRFMSSNPCDQVTEWRKAEDPKSQKQFSKVPSVLGTIEKVKSAINIASEYAKEGYFGFTVLSLFCGFRPSELEEMNKTTDPYNFYFKLEGSYKSVLIDGIGKTQQARSIELTQNAVEWILFLQKKEYPICYLHWTDAGHRTSFYGRTLRKIRRRIFLSQEDQTLYETLTNKDPKKKELQKILKQNQDCYRHTYGTYLLHHKGLNMNYVVNQMGHTSKTYMKHYRGLLKNSDLHSEYFAITPQSMGYS
tara:strand:+ start:178 stop:1653 length:1476 start_codon:yes stop_codon:yes gene_type:complete